MEYSLAFEVNKADPKQTRAVSDSIPDGLEPGQVLLKVDCFALTSNKITFAMVGEANVRQRQDGDVFPPWASITPAAARL